MLLNIFVINVDSTRGDLLELFSSLSGIFHFNLCVTMKSYSIRLLALPFCACLFLSCSNTIPSELAKEGIKGDDMRRIKTIQPGSTREELLKVFMNTGGISSARQAQFRYRECRTVAVDVKFQCQRDEMGRMGFHPQDRIISISSPYYAPCCIGD